MLSDGKGNVYTNKQDFEKVSEKQCKKWFSSLGMQIEEVNKKELKKGNKTPDYKILSENIGIECSVVNGYKNAERITALREQLCNKMGTVQRFKLTCDESCEVHVELINEFKINDKIAVLIVEYDLSGVRKKHLSKLKKEMKHFEKYEKCLLVLDYRYFMFHSIALTNEWKDILQQYGGSYANLLGVILITLKTPEDDVTEDLPDLQFVQNPHTLFQIPKELKTKNVEDQFTVKSAYIEICVQQGSSFTLDRKFLKKCGLYAEKIRVHTLEFTI